MRIDAHAHGDPGSFQGDPQAYVTACRKRGMEAIVLIESLERCLRGVEIFGDLFLVGLDGS